MGRPYTRSNLVLVIVIFYCPDLHCNKLYCTVIAVDFAESTSLQCPALYDKGCTALFEFKAIVILPMTLQNVPLQLAANYIEGNNIITHFLLLFSY